MNDEEIKNREIEILGEAAHGNYKKVIELLKKNGIHEFINSIDEEGSLLTQTVAIAIDFPTKRVPISHIKWLLEQGADPDLTFYDDNVSYNALAICILLCDYDEYNLKVIDLLLEYGSNIDYRVEAGTILMKAIRNNNLEAVQLCLEKGADTEYYDEILEESVLDVAKTAENPEILKIIQNPNLRINSKNQIICTCNLGYEDKLTIGKAYTIVLNEKEFYQILDDNNQKIEILKSRFEI